MPAPTAWPFVFAVGFVVDFCRAADERLGKPARCGVLRSSALWAGSARFCRTSITRICRSLLEAEPAVVAAPEVTRFPIARECPPRVVAA